MNKIKINVTQKNINEGVKCSKSNCMIANALIDINMIDIKIDGRHSFEARSPNETRINYYAFPEYVTSQMLLFDSGERIAPFSFIAYNLFKKI